MEFQSVLVEPSFSHSDSSDDSSVTVGVAPVLELRHGARRRKDLVGVVRQRFAVESSPDGGPYANDRTLAAVVDALPVFPEFDSRLEAVRLSVYLGLKRVIDVLVSLVLLVVLSPVFLITSILIKLFNRGPAFYPHVRVGLNGTEFTCFKFRTMVVDAEKMKVHLTDFNTHADNRTFKIPNDPRVTAVGRWLRRTSLDELPQLINVLVGDMSLVGPRPPVPGEVERYTWHDKRRLEVKPGLTCIWQVSGRSSIPFPQQLQMDLEYIRNRSILLDAQLLLKTIPAVLSLDGAY